MRFTPAQAIALADISVETLRYWKKFVPCLSDKRGHAPCYSRAEIVGLIVVRQLVRDFKMDVSALLASQSEILFRLCATQWTRPSRRILCVTSNGSVTAHDGLVELDLSKPAIVFPLDLAVDELEQRLNEQESQPQLELALPPVPFKTKTRNAL